MPQAYRLLITEAQNLETLFAAMSATSPDRPKLIRRLADTYAALGVAVPAQGGKPQTAAAARSRAIMYYTMLLTRFPQWCASSGTPPAGCRDETLYYLGLEYERGGDTALAWKTYLDLIHRHPQSSFAPSTYLAFGELELSTRDPSRLPLAEKAYQDALKYPPLANVVWGYAQYQLGRVRAQLGDAKQAASSFRSVLTWAQQNPSAPASAELLAAARQELAALGKP